MRISYRIDGVRSGGVSVLPSACVAEVTRAICAQHGLDGEAHLLTDRANQLRVLDEWSSLADYGVPDGAELCVVRRVPSSLLAVREAISGVILCDFDAASAAHASAQVRMLLGRSGGAAKGRRAYRRCGASRKHVRCS